MQFSMVHFNFNVSNLDKSIKFYSDALGLEEAGRIEPPTGEFIIVYLKGEGDFRLELTWLRDRKEPYNLGDNEIHLAFHANDYEAAYQKHRKMDCICYENPQMGIYFISDPDGYWLEVVP